MIDWYGPFSSEEEAKLKADQHRLIKGLYVKIGNQKAQRGTERLQYIGYSGNFQQRLSPKHAKLPLVTKRVEIWLGEVGSHRIPNRTRAAIDPAEDLAEWLHAGFVRKSSNGIAFPLNEKKTRGVPKVAATVVNHWWTIRDPGDRTKDEPFESILKSPHEWWPYVIDYYGSGYQHKRGQTFTYEARLTWLDGSWDLVSLSQ